jgi:hypothetical protein
VEHRGRAPADGSAAAGRRASAALEPGDDGDRWRSGGRRESVSRDRATRAVQQPLSNVHIHYTLTPLQVERWPRARSSYRGDTGVPIDSSVATSNLRSRRRCTLCAGS